MPRKQLNDFHVPPESFTEASTPLRPTDVITLHQDLGDSEFASRRTTPQSILEFVAMSLRPATFLPFDWESKEVTSEEMISGIGLQLTSLAGVTALCLDQVLQCVFVDLTDAPDLVEMSFPRLQQITGGSWSHFTCNSLPQLIALRQPALLRLDGDFDCSGCGTLFTIEQFSLRYLNGDYSAYACALSKQVVNATLALLVAANSGSWARSVDLSGGTNAAPTGQGLEDKATLIARGATVTTNEEEHA